MNVSQSRFRPLAYLAVVALAAVLISAVVAVDAEAARGGSGGGGKGGRGGGSTGTMTASPNPAPVGITAVTLSGSGFSPGEGLSVGLPGVIPSYSIVTDASGNFSFTYSKAGNAPFSAGQYPFEAHRWQSGGWVFATSVTLVVQ